LNAVGAGCIELDLIYKLNFSKFKNLDIYNVEKLNFLSKCCA